MERHEQIIAHHGIKGMKWGVRRTPKQLKNNPDYEPLKTKTVDEKRKAIKTSNERKKAEMKSAVKNRRILSDEELKRRIERIRLEKQLKDLTDEEISPGKKIVQEIMSNSGKKVASTIVAGAMLYGTKYALTKEFDAKDMAGYLAPKPKNK